jgi:23S rRNA (adenine2503-C2)-methyltransferase
MRALTDYDLEGLRATFESWGCKASQADRILLDFYKYAGHVDLARLNLGRALLGRLRTHIPLRQSGVLARHESRDGTVKLLLGLERGGAIETVLMPTGTKERAAGCISSQVGCAMGCAFCASTRGGLERNLESGEMIEQFLHLKEQALATGRRLATVVFMGSGEPLLNLDNVVAATKRIAGPALGDVGWRQVTVSTVGIVPGILKLAAMKLRITLALSLHAPDDETRSRIVPANKRYGVREIVAATKRFSELTGRVTNVEYCLIAGVNDSDGHARALAALLDGFRTHVNLIPCNSIGAGFVAPPLGRQQQFLRLLRNAGVVAHLRCTRGDDVSAACGQLRGVRREA